MGGPPGWEGVVVVVVGGEGVGLSDIGHCTVSADDTLVMVVVGGGRCGLGGNVGALGHQVCIYFLRLVFLVYLIYILRLVFLVYIY